MIYKTLVAIKKLRAMATAFISSGKAEPNKFAASVRELCTDLAGKITEWEEIQEKEAEKAEKEKEKEEKEAKEKEK